MNDILAQVSCYLNSFVVELAIRYDATFGEWNLGCNKN
ncbi:unnamed protein product [Camellia sinensis]